MGKKLGSLLQLASLVPNLFKLSSVARLIKDESQAAVNNFILLLVLLTLFASLLITLWCTILCLLFSYFIALHINPILSLFFILLLNLTVLIFASFFLLMLKRNVSFPLLRQQIAKLRN